MTAPAERDTAVPSGEGRLPNLLVLGAQKSGTTALADALRRHPDVFMAHPKELHHFGEVPDEAAAGPEYRAHFAGWQGQRWVGEATPAYLYLPAAARQIGRHLPGLTAVVVLRNPVDRAYSAYWAGRAKGVLAGSFEACLDAEPARLAAGDWGFASLVDRGRYLEQLQRHLDAGLARDRLHVMLHDDLVGDPTGALAALARFLELDTPIAELARANTAKRYLLPAPVVRRLLARRAHPVASAALRLTRRPLRYPPMAPATRARLVATFAADNEALGRWLGRDLSHWDR